MTLYFVTTQNRNYNVRLSYSLSTVHLNCSGSLFLTGQTSVGEVVDRPWYSLKFQCYHHWLKKNVIKKYTPRIVVSLQRDTFRLTERSLVTFTRPRARTHRLQHFEQNYFYQRGIEFVWTAKDRRFICVMKTVYFFCRTHISRFTLPTQWASSLSIFNFLFPPYFLRVFCPLKDICDLFCTHSWCVYFINSLWG